MLIWRYFKHFLACSFEAPEDILESHTSPGTAANRNVKDSHSSDWGSGVFQLQGYVVVSLEWYRMVVCLTLGVAYRKYELSQMKIQNDQYVNTYKDMYYGYLYIYINLYTIHGHIHGWIFRQCIIFPTHFSWPKWLECLRRLSLQTTLWRGAWSSTTRNLKSYVPWRVQ